jgi:glycosyltransferase involved in cell wall biosynthesis
MPLVSVVIPTYNRARDLERCLGSVLRQTWSDFEVIVVDNHSTDDTEAVIAGFADPRIVMVRIHNNGIVAKSRNLGIQRASGEFIAFLDSDDWWKPRKLEYSMQPLTAGADVAFHDLHLVTSARQRLFLRNVRSWNVTPPILRDLLLNDNALPQSSVVIRRSLLLAVGGMTEEAVMVAMEDYDCWLRVATLTDKFVRVDRTLGFYWAGGGNITTDVRTVELLNLFEQRYSRQLLAAGASETPWWITFARGRAYYRLGERGMARRHFASIPLRAVPRVAALKTLWMRLVLAVSRV